MSNFLNNFLLPKKIQKQTESNQQNLCKTLANKKAAGKMLLKREPFALLFFYQKNCKLKL